MFDYTVATGKGYEPSIEDLKKSLAGIKFGVLWELDVPSKLAEKGVHWEGRMRILEVCSPQHAKEALEKDIRVGYFLPCKIIVYEHEGRTMVGMVRPSVIVETVGNPDLRAFAAEVEEKLVAAIDEAR